MKAWRLPSLRLTLPAMLLLFVGTTGFYVTLRHTALAERAVEVAALDDATNDLNQLQGSIEELLRRGDLESIRREVAAFGVEDNVRVVSVVDDDDRVVASSQFALVGQRFAGGLAEPPADASEHRDRIAAVKSSLAGAIHVASDRRSFEAYYPVLFGTRSREVRPSRVGLLFSEYDLEGPKAAARRRISLQTLEFSLLLGGLAILMAAFFQIAVTQRMRRIIRASERFAAGELAARTELRSCDEVGLVGQAFDRMADVMAADQLKLREREEHFRSLIENASDLIAVVDLNGTLVYASPSHRHVLGYAPEELVGRNALSLVHPDDRAAFNEVIQRQVSAGTARPMEFRLQHASGAWRVVESSGRLMARNGESRLVLNGRDVSERKQAEAAIRQLNADLDRRVRERTAQLEATNKELEAFSYGVSHDLRAPLRAIDGFSSLLLDHHQAQLDPHGRHYLERVREGVGAMAQLIEALLGLSRLSRTDLQWREVDLSELAEAAANDLRAADPGRAVQFHAAPHIGAYGDPHLLRVVLNNLLGNAWKYTGKHATAEIEFGMQQRDDERVYFVRDDGAGFDMQYVGKLFGAFQRLHAKEDFEGTGIGLATVQRIIHRHGGRVWAEGAVEHGATFYFTLGAGPDAAGASA